jgi:hypothetical protein
MLLGVEFDVLELEFRLGGTVAGGSSFRRWRSGATLPGLLTGSGGRGRDRGVDVVILPEEASDAHFLFVRLAAKLLIAGRIGHDPGYNGATSRYGGGGGCRRG